MKLAWEHYKNAVIPRDAGKVQLEQTEIAFYAGATIVYNVMFDIGEMKEKEAMIVMNDLREEVTEFCDDQLKKSIVDLKNVSCFPA